MSIKFPYSRPAITPEDIAAVAKVFEQPMLTQGPYVSAFEAAFQAAFGAKAALTCSNGTAALHLAYMALGVGPEAGVVVPEITFLATANAARMCGAPVWFADVDPETGLMTPATLLEALETAPFPVRAAAPVHLAGRPCDMPALRDVAERFGVDLVEDACHAPGAVYRDQAGTEHAVGACAHSSAAAFSLHAIKHIAAGEGGVVAVRDRERAAEVALLRSHGMIRDPGDWTYAPDESPAPWYYEMRQLGWNYRLTDIQAALALSQLSRLEANLAKRRYVAARYREILADLDGAASPPPTPEGWTHAYHLFPLQIDFGRSAPPRGVVMSRLAEAGVGSQVLYIPVSSQPYYQDLGARQNAGAKRYYERTLAIPMYEDLSEDDQAEIIAALKKAMQ